MASISQNQYDYLNNLVKAGGGNGEWAKSQLAGATVDKPAVVAPTAPVAPVTPMAPTTPAPTTTTKPSFYTGPANIVGNISGTNNLAGSLSQLGQTQLANKPSGTQFQGWTDTNTGNVYDTSGMSPQQAYALELNVTNNPKRDAILKSMGLDTNGNPTSYANTPTFNVPSQLNPSQQSAQDWINNSASNQGGIQQYVAGQLAKYNQAVQSGDTDMLNRLQADSQRVGYSLPSSGGNAPQGGGSPFGGGAVAPATGGGGGAIAPMGDDALRKQITDQVNAAIAAQELALNQGADTANQGFGLALSQNQNALNEGIGNINKQTVVNRQAAQELQNRRGGFYSGGLDYQLGNIDSSANEAIGGLQRDVNARNADIASKIAMNKQQAADKIAQLRSAAPIDIQTKLQSALAARQEAQAKAQQQQFENDVKLAGTTGYYNDSQQRQAVMDKMAQNSAAYANASPAEQQRLHAENVALAASIGGQDTTGSGDYAFGPGSPTLAREKQDYEQASAADKTAYDRAYTQARDQIKDAQWAAKFDQDEQQWGLTFAADNAYKNGQLSISARNAAVQEANAATSQAREERLSKEGSTSTPKVDKNELEAQYVEGFDSIPTANRKKAFEAEKGNIIRDLGKSGYDALYKTYFDEDGDPR